MTTLDVQKELQDYADQLSAERYAADDAIDIPRRNRAIKKLLVERFGRGNVSVLGSRGTAHGWVTVRLIVPPDSPPSHDEVERIILAAGLRLHSYVDGEDNRFYTRLAVYETWAAP